MNSKADICMLLSLCLVFGCAQRNEEDGSEIDFIKKSALPNNAYTSWVDAVDCMAKSATWEVCKSDKGRKFVEVNGTLMGEYREYAARKCTPDLDKADELANFLSGFPAVTNYFVKTGTDFELSREKRCRRFMEKVAYWVDAGCPTNNCVAEFIVAAKAVKDALVYKNASSGCQLRLLARG